MNDTTKQASQRYEIRSGLYGVAYILDWQTDLSFTIVFNSDAEQLCDLLNAQDTEIKRLQAIIDSQQPPNEMAVCERCHKPTTADFAMVDEMWLCSICQSTWQDLIADDQED